MVRFNPPDVTEAWRGRGKKRVRGDGLLPPEIKGGKHGAIFRKMLATWNDETVLALIEEFFTTTDPRIVRGDYTVEWLYTNAQYMLTSRGRLDPLTAANVDAGRRAMERP